MNIRRGAGTLVLGVIVALGALGIGAGLRAYAAGEPGQAAGGAAGQANAPGKLITVPAEVPASATRYSFLFSGNNAGVMAGWTTAGGARHNFFAFNARGRGPSIMTRIVLDRAGYPAEIDATGNDYYKKAVDEHFRMTGTPLRATWSNK